MQSRSHATQTRILKAATDLFARAGYDGASVDDICQAAGVSKGAFYHHFASKHAVFMRLLEDWLARLDALIEQSVGSAGDIPGGLVDMAGQVGFIFEAARDKLPMFLEFWAQSSRQPDVWQATVAPYRHYAELFGRLVAHGAAEGSLQPVEAGLGARTIAALAIGMLLQGLLDPTGADWSETTRQGMRLLLDGLQRRSS